MDRTLMYLSVLQVGLTYVSGFATAEFFLTRTDNWGLTAVATTIFLLMSSKWETYKRIEALLGPLPAHDSPKDLSKPKEKTGLVGFSLPLTK